MACFLLFPKTLLWKSSAFFLHKFLFQVFVFFFFMLMKTLEQPLSTLEATISIVKILKCRTGVECGVVYGEVKVCVIDTPAAIQLAPIFFLTIWHTTAWYGQHYTWLPLLSHFQEFTHFCSWVTWVWTWTTDLAMRNSALMASLFR